jgi:hypothetical protein
MRSPGVRQSGPPVLPVAIRQPAFILLLLPLTPFLISFVLTVESFSHLMKHLFRRAVVAPLALGSASLLYLLRFPRPPRNGPPDSDHEMFRHARAEYLAQMPTTQLLRSLFVHSFCSHSRLVDIGMWVMKSPSLQNPVFDYVIRQTFFAEFCG